MEKSGLKNSLSQLNNTIIIGCINFICTFIAFLLIDKIGRKRLLIIGTAGIVISYAYLLFISYLNAQNILFSFGLFLFIASFALGPGVVVWVLISELFPTELRSRMIALCLFLNSLTAAILSSFYPLILGVINIKGSYLLFMLFSLMYFALSIIIPETKNKSLEEIQNNF
jgi:MFS family permease